MWESVPEGGPGECWAELDENGCGALIGWAAGPENLRRGPAVDDSARTVTVTRTDRDGTVTECIEAFTAHDRQIVDEETNSFLADAGVEKRPGGFRWFVRLPEQLGMGGVPGRCHRGCLRERPPDGSSGRDPAGHGAGHTASVRLLLQLTCLMQCSC